MFEAFCHGVALAHSQALGFVCSYICIYACFVLLAVLLYSLLFCYSAILLVSYYTS